MGKQKNDNRSRVKERSEIQEKSKEIFYVNKNRAKRQNTCSPFYFSSNNII